MDFHSTSYGKISGSNPFALKLDLHKAFARVEWNFLESILVAMHFFLTLVSLTTHYVRSVHFLVPINGCPSPLSSLLMESVKETLYLLTCLVYMRKVYL